MQRLLEQVLVGHFGALQGYPRKVQKFNPLSPQGIYSENFDKAQPCLISVFLHLSLKVIFLFVNIEAIPTLAKTKTCACVVTNESRNNIRERTVSWFHILVKCLEDWVLHQTWRTPVYCFCDYLPGHGFVEWNTKWRFSGTRVHNIFLYIADQNIVHKHNGVLWRSKEKNDGFMLTTCNQSDDCLATEQWKWFIVLLLMHNTSIWLGSDFRIGSF